MGSIKNAAELQREASLLGAAKLNNVSEVNRLIRLGTNLDATSKGWTALAAAAGVGNHKVINALIRAGASVDAENDDGYMRCTLPRKVVASTPSNCFIPWAQTSTKLQRTVSGPSSSPRIILKPPSSSC